MESENVVVLGREAARDFYKDVTREKTPQEKEELKTAKEYYLKNCAKRRSNRSQ